MGISKITTKNNHVSSNNTTTHDGKIGYNSAIAINNHVNTHCFVNTFQIVSMAEKVCYFTEFLNELATTNNFSIATANTVIIDNNITVFITVFG